MYAGSWKDIRTQAGKYLTTLSNFKKWRIVDYIEKGKDRCYFVKNSCIIREIAGCLKESKNLMK